jgi:hypothetical protein
MMRKSLPVAMALLLAAAACGPAKVVVTMQIASENPESGTATTTPGKDIEVRMLPFDRDSVFDSLTAAYGTPEPAIPKALMDQRDSVRVAQQRWQAAERRWANLRDTLETLNKAMKQYNRGESKYVALYNEFNTLDGQLSGVNKVKDKYFQEFSDLQKATITAADSIKILRENWSDEAFRSVDSVFEAKQRATGQKIQVDTTDANGMTTFQVSPGKWWVTARYELPFTELYWNVFVDAKRGNPIQVKLTRENAKEREQM